MPRAGTMKEGGRCKKGHLLEGSNIRYRLDSRGIIGISCRECQSARHKEYHQKTYTTMSSIHIRMNGAPPLEEKPDKCDICQTISNRIVYDHDYATGKFRGFLRRPCNTNLGWFEKKESRIRAYLDRVKSS